MWIDKAGSYSIVSKCSLKTICTLPLTFWRLVFWIFPFFPRSIMLTCRTFSKRYWKEIQWGRRRVNQQSRCLYFHPPSFRSNLLNVLEWNTNFATVITSFTSGQFLGTAPHQLRSFPFPCFHGKCLVLVGPWIINTNSCITLDTGSPAGPLLPCLPLPPPNVFHPSCMSVGSKGELRIISTNSTPKKDEVRDLYLRWENEKYWMVFVLR